MTPVDGGVHPRFGTRNMILPLADDRYIEVVEVLDHPASDKAPFGQVVRARSESGGGWMGWVIAVDDLAEVEGRLGREAVEGCRKLADGRSFEEWFEMEKFVDGEAFVVYPDSNGPAWNLNGTSDLAFFDELADVQATAAKLAQHFRTQVCTEEKISNSI